eukprot:TRINITY_DN6840_c0_g1_i6.p1 TRINITY_DN6840_c0_g1~~TRINITY_DN6840_c0_g1_i6.p1  ORF type:complete len:107 (+),score=9.78 TRINITY_DN6840_c0_g1_i6:100-420(+)
MLWSPRISRRNAAFFLEADSAYLEEDGANGDRTRTFPKIIANTSTESLFCARCWSNSRIKAMMYTRTWKWIFGIEQRIYFKSPNERGKNRSIDSTGVMNLLKIMTE